MRITYQPASGPPVFPNAIFSDPYVRQPGDPEGGVESLEPRVFLQLAELPIDPELDEPTLVINGKTYRVTERLAAGLGAVSLALRLL